MRFLLSGKPIASERWDRHIFNESEMARSSECMACRARQAAQTMLSLHLLGNFNFPCQQLIGDLPKFGQFGQAVAIFRPSIIFLERSSEGHEHSCPRTGGSRPRNEHNRRGPTFTSALRKTHHSLRLDQICRVEHIPNGLLLSRSTRFAVSEVLNHDLERGQDNDAMGYYPEFAGPGADPLYTSTEIFCGRRNHNILL